MQSLFHSMTYEASEALRKIQQEYLPKNNAEKRVLGVLIPAAEEAVERTKNHRIGVIATEGTVNSEAFAREIQKLNNKTKIFQKACPLLVPIVESGEQNSKASDLILKDYLNPLMKKNIDTLILGCTHYGILEKKIRKTIGVKVNIINEGKIVAKKLKDYLRRRPEIENNISKSSTVEFLTTDLTDRFQILGSKFFGRKIITEKVELK